MTRFNPKNIAPLLVSTAAVACSVPASTAPVTEDVNDDKVRLEQLNGVWASEGPEEWDGAYGRRTFAFEDGQWSLIFDFGFDPELKQKVFTFRTDGAYRVGERSSDVPNAFRTVFDEKRKFLTFYPNDPALAAQFGMGECGLTPGVEKDISQAGCAVWKPVAECGEDHDLFAIDEEDRLYFGVRPADNDMCTPDRTPTALLAPVVKQ